MTHHLITPANASDIARAQPGDTLVLSGAFPKQALTGLSNLTILAHDATLGNWLFSKCSGVHIYGGTVTLGLGFVDCAGSGFHFMKLDNPAKTGVGAGHQRCTGQSVTGNTLTGWDHALTFSSCHDVIVIGNDLSGYGSDGLDGGSVWGMTIRLNRFHDPAPKPGAHADAIQIYSQAGAEPCRDIVIDDNTMTGALQQSIFLEDKAGVGRASGGFDRVEVCGNIAESVIHVSGARVLKLRDNRVTTAKDAGIIANIYAENCTGIDRGGNSVADAPWIGLHGKRGWTEP